MTTVLHVAEVLKGGTASYIDELLSDQVRRYGADKLCLLVPASQVGSLTQAAGVEIVAFPDGGRLANLRALQRFLKQLLSRRSFDLVHVHGTFAGVALRTMAWPGGRPPLIYCAHGWSFDRQAAGWKCALMAAAERLLAWRCERIICISEHDHASAVARGLPRDKLVTVRNGIRDQPATPGPAVSWPASKLRILFAGRFDYQKGIDLLYGAMSELGPEYAAIAIGDASAGDFELTADLPSVVQTGWLARDQVQAYLHSCDVFVMPSRWEGFGLSALEAMRAGRAVVATGVGGLPELVRDGVNGYLVEANSVPALVEALAKLTPERIAAMGQAGRARFETFFDAARMNREIAALYDTVLAPAVSVHTERV
ncbi:glycosyltransferase [Duganella aceris]|uniref:Glycosyltransferase family 4 protein n=1 Tax=Duganella aceris TaxID=2703883 RepID=A0ABX0FUF9_9BURK|nr:glycosyltransferase [Duganella aceris]NGZ88022.1 glycosyltransferase family 4 protein [Duganella aceris]